MGGGRGREKKRVKKKRKKEKERGRVGIGAERIGRDGMGMGGKMKREKRGGKKGREKRGTGLTVTSGEKRRQFKK